MTEPRRIKSAALKDQLAAILRDVDRGATYIVEHYNRPVAQITPYKEPTMELVTAEHVTDLHNAKVYDSHLRQTPVIARAHDGELVVCHNPTPENNGWDVIYTAEQLNSWLDGTDLGEGEAETIANQINDEITR